MSIDLSIALPGFKHAVTLKTNAIWLFYRPIASQTISTLFKIKTITMGLCEVGMVVRNTEYMADMIPNTLCGPFNWNSFISPTASMA